MNQSNDGWPINHKQLPQRIQISLPLETLKALEMLAQRSGRTIDEVVVELLDLSIQRE
jgi:hypothetical protein